MQSVKGTKRGICHWIIHVDSFRNGCGLGLWINGDIRLPIECQTVTIGALTLGLGVDYAVRYAHECGRASC